MFTQDETTIYTNSPKVHVKDSNDACLTVHYILARDTFQLYSEPVQLIILRCEEHNTKPDSNKPDKSH